MLPVSIGERSETGLAPDALALIEKVRGYLGPEQADKVRRAYELGALAHAGQVRRSGEPYITHPVAVAHILADLGLDAETLCAAILHDTLEDTCLERADIVAHFGETVAELVEGVTKLDRVRFRSRQEADAESFRKMVLAMARDLRVILVKLSDRLHNMRTLDAMEPSARRRIARETLEVYAPIAQRLGMNRFKAELQDLGFRALYPFRHRVIEHRLRSVYGLRRDAMVRIEAQIAETLERAGLKARIVSRMKSPYSIYRKMRTEQRALRKSPTFTDSGSWSKNRCSATSRSGWCTVCSSRWKAASRISSPSPRPMAISRCTPCSSGQTACPSRSRFVPKIWTPSPSAGWQPTGFTKRPRRR